MKLINKTKDEVLAESIREPRTLKEKMVGLLGKKEPESIYFKSRWGVHTLGMNFPIDCIVCDESMVVRKIKRSLCPGRFFFWNPKFNNVIELPPGTVEESNTAVLDKLEIK